MLALLARDDPEVQKIVTSVIGESEAARRPAADVEQPDPDEVAVRQTAISDAAAKIARAYSHRGWMYIGTLKDEEWKTRPQIKIDAGLPQTGQSYDVTDDTYLRSARPKFPTYKLASAIAVVKRGDNVLIEEVATDVGRDRVWARVRVTPAD